MNKILDVSAIEILDSRGVPTLRVTVFAENGKGIASIPSGASKGKLEALELRDQDPHRYFGKGVLKAKNSVTGEIRANLLGKDVTDQKTLDKILIELDGTPNKSRLGANAILGASLACAKCSANAQGLELYELWDPNKKGIQPIPMMNIINGGEHANNSLDYQEFMIYPKGFDSIEKRIQVGSEIFHTLKKLLSDQGISTAVGDEGGFSPNCSSPEEALDWIMQAIEKSGYQPGSEVSITLDVAASFFYKDGQYLKDKKAGSQEIQSKEELISSYKALIQKYPIDSIEDGLDETDWDGWKQLTTELGSSIQLVGDDLFVTNPEYVQKGIDQGIANAVLIKLNQIGTVTETFDTIDLAHNNGYKTVISHRSGETVDTTIADLCFATGSGQIKTGSLCRSERTEKYNRLLEIAQRTSC